MGAEQKRHELVFTVRVIAEDMDGTPEQSAEIIGDIINAIVKEGLPHDVDVEATYWDVENDR